MSDISVHTAISVFNALSAENKVAFLKIVNAKKKEETENKQNWKQHVSKLLGAEYEEGNEELLISKITKK